MEKVHKKIHLKKGLYGFMYSLRHFLALRRLLASSASNSLIRHTYNYHN